MSLPVAPPSLEKLLQLTQKIVQNADEALMGKKVTVDYLAILENLQFIAKYMEEESHLTLIMKYKNSLFLNILTRDEKTEPQWRIIKSFVISLLGNLFEIDEVNDSDEILSQKINAVSDLVEKEDFLNILGRAIAFDHENMKERFEDRKLVFGLIKLLNTIIESMSTEKLVNILLKKQNITLINNHSTLNKPQVHLNSSNKRENLNNGNTASESFTFAFQILKFLIVGMKGIWDLESNLTEVEKADIFLYSLEVLDNITLESEAMRKFFSSNDNPQLIIDTIIDFCNRESKIASEIEGFSHFMNLISTCQSIPTFQSEFANHNGVKELIRLIKLRKYSRESGIRALYYSITNNREIIEKFMHLWNGISIVFALFMKPLTESGMEYILEILEQMINYNDPKIHLRFLRKFKERSFEKADKLIHLFIKYHEKLTDFEESIRSGSYVKVLLEVENFSTEEELEDRIIADRLSNGLYYLRLISKVIGYVCDDQIRDRIVVHLTSYGLTINSISEVLEEYIDFIHDEEEIQRCIILLSFLKGEALSNDIST